MYETEFHDDELYESQAKQIKELSKNLLIKEQAADLEKELIELETRTPMRQAQPQMEPEEIQPLKLASSKIVGSLFDRVEFLKERLDENTQATNLRKALHDAIMKEVDTDIDEKREIESRIADFNEKRNFKLDISILRREKRHEHLQFWRDMLELRAELRELLEQYLTESKIARLFRESDDGDT
ncbi:MAG: hypothetical protein HY519_02575 [Candidatus Aenigmarchaeota archaeon]|nr:hypothetical protein [Candidatus Aenigmarchaeota archaeon]